MSLDLNSTEQRDVKCRSTKVLQQRAAKKVIKENFKNSAHKCEPDCKLPFLRGFCNYKKRAKHKGM